MLSTKDKQGELEGSFIEILEFTHFARIFQFNRVFGNGMDGQEMVLKKEISHGVKVSVVMELV